MQRNLRLASLLELMRESIASLKTPENKTAF
jgi:hypothetical protein